MKDVKKIAIVTAAFGRFELFRIFCQHHLKLQTKHLKIRIYVSSHEKEIRDICDEFEGVVYVDCPNRPIGNKFNQSCLRAKTWKPDGVLVMGSDNFISRKLLVYLLSEVQNGQYMAGVLDSYVYSTKLGKLAYNGGYINYRRGEILGAYKMLSPKLLDKFYWMPWNGRINMSLDYSLMQNFKAKFKANWQSNRIKDQCFFCVGIKTGKDMNEFGKGSGNISFTIIQDGKFRAEMPVLFDKIKQL